MAGGPFKPSFDGWPIQAFFGLEWGSYPDTLNEGSLAMTTDGSGNVLGTNLLSPYGEVLSSTTASDSYSYAGLTQDTEYGGDAATFRNYSTEQLRWLRPDPTNGSYDLANPQSMNRYVYAMNNPLNNVDPSELDGEDENGNVINSGSDSNGDTWTTFGFPDGSTITIYTLQTVNTTVNVNDGYTNIGTWGITSGYSGTIGGFGITRTFVTASPPVNPTPPKSPDSIVQCVAQAQSKARTNRKILLATGGVGLGNVSAACLLSIETGPGFLVCEGSVAALELIYEGVSEYGVHSEEQSDIAQCMSN